MPAHEFGGDWTEQKLRVLDNYLIAYSRIFQKNPGARHLETIYVDAFAGTGIIQRKAKHGNEEELFTEFAQPETIEFLQGSAARALQHQFTRYVFIEKSAASIAALEKLKALSEFKDRIAVYRADANKRLIALIDSTD
jgi:three-Cys-motif partner protein